MATAQRLSRGFHRLGLFLAAIPLIVGVLAVAWVTLQADRALDKHSRLACVGDHIAQALPIQTKETPEGIPFDDPIPPPPNGAVIDWKDDYRINPKQVGCSDDLYETITYGEVRNPPAFDWLKELGLPLALAVAVTLAVSLSVYGIVRAIGWVIGGFMAS
jgi:hypothetical protein